MTHQGGPMLTRFRPLVEVAVDSVAAAVMAAALGADRLELCQDLEVGGTTPSLGLIGAVRERVSIPVAVMIRPRAGDFVYGPDEFRVMEADIRHAILAGANGVVVGPLTADGGIDQEGLKRLVGEAGPVPVAFHRAFDSVTRPLKALDVLIALKVARLLTSGGGVTAYEGRAAIGRLVERAGSELTVIAGGGVTAEHVAALLNATGVREIHLSGVSQVRVAGGEFGMTPVPNPGRLMRIMEVLKP